MKKIFASMMMLAATSTGFAQQVTAPEPEFINSYCVLTSDSTFDALPKEDGMISIRQICQDSRSYWRLGVCRRYDRGQYIWKCFWYN